MSLRQLHSRQRKGSKAAESYLKRMYEQGSNVTFAQVCKEIFAHAEVWWFFRDMISLHKDKPQFIEDVNTVCLSEEEVTRPNVKLGCVYHAKSKLLHALVARKSYQAYKALAVVEGIDLTVKNSQRQTPEKYAESLRRKRYILPKK